MANSFNEKLKIVCKLLSERHLTFVGDVNNELKCGICKNILIDAQLTSCGCNFCKKCIDDHKHNEGDWCPGNNDECKYNDLSNMFLDQRINRQISRLIVRCIEDNCGFECELINMDAHLLRCPKKSLNCPFRIVGCEEQMNVDIMNEHLQVKSEIHTKLMMEVINNLRNEINELRDNDKRNKAIITRLMEETARNNKDIDVLREMFDDIRVKHENRDEENEKKFQSIVETRMVSSNLNPVQDERIENIIKDMESLKVKVEEIKTQITGQGDALKFDNERQKVKMDDLEERLVKRNDYIDLQIKDFVSVKKAIMNLKKMEDNSGKEMNKIVAMVNERCKMRDVELLINENIKIIKMEIDNRLKEKGDKEVGKKVNKLEKNLGIFKWNIGAIDRLVADKYIDSENFYDQNNLYKIGLRLCLLDEKSALSPLGLAVLSSAMGMFSDKDWGFGPAISLITSPNSSSDSQNCDTLIVHILLYQGQNDALLKWPFNADVTIKISDPLNPNNNKSITENCVIYRPTGKVPFNVSERFKFSRFDLQNVGLWSNNCNVECAIVYQ